MVKYASGNVVRCVTRGRRQHLAFLFSQPMNPDDIARMYEVAKNVQGSERYVVLWCDTVLEGLEKQGIEIPPEDKYYSDPSKQASLEDLNRETQPIQGNE